MDSTLTTRRSSSETLTSSSLSSRAAGSPRRLSGGRTPGACTCTCARLPAPPRAPSWAAWSTSSSARAAVTAPRWAGEGGGRPGPWTCTRCGHCTLVGGGGWGRPGPWTCTRCGHCTQVGGGGWGRPGPWTCRAGIAPPTLGWQSCAVFRLAAPCFSFVCCAPLTLPSEATLAAGGRGPWLRTILAAGGRGPWLRTTLAAGGRGPWLRTTLAAGGREPWLRTTLPCWQHPAQVKEQFTHLSLDLPAEGERRLDGAPPRLQHLLDAFFKVGSRPAAGACVGCSMAAPRACTRPDHHTCKLIGFHGTDFHPPPPAPPPHCIPPPPPPRRRCPAGGGGVQGVRGLPGGRRPALAAPHHPAPAARAVRAPQALPGAPPACPPVHCWARGRGGGGHLAASPTPTFNTRLQRGVGSALLSKRRMTPHCYTRCPTVAPSF
jgi:hypothetical protein